MCAPIYTFLLTFQLLFFFPQNLRSSWNHYWKIEKQACENSQDYFKLEHFIIIPSRIYYDFTLLPLMEARFPRIFSKIYFLLISFAMERIAHAWQLPLASDIFKECLRGAWVAQSVKCPISAQVMISQSVSSSPALGSVLRAQSLESASDSVSPSLSAPPLLMLCLSLSQK